MPIICNFPICGGGNGDIVLGAVSNVSTIVSHGKVYLKWTDPDDVIAPNAVLAVFAGTLLVRKAGSPPTDRRDGVVVLDNKTRNAYQNAYFCDSGLMDGVTYYYKFFPYTTQKVYTNSEDNVLEVTPAAVAPANVSNFVFDTISPGVFGLKWTDPDDSFQDGIKTVAWGGTKVVYKRNAVPANENDGVLIVDSTVKNAYRSTFLEIPDVEQDGYYCIAMFPYGTEAYGGAVNTNESNVTSISLASKTLNNNSWETISRIASSGEAANYWAVGDRKAVALNGTVGSLTFNDTYYCYIIGFDHNSDKEGMDRIHFQFGYDALREGVQIAFTDSKYGDIGGADYFSMNTGSSNAGGWENCYARTTLCPAFKNVMPSDLQNVLKTVTKYSDNTGGNNASSVASYVTSTTDTVFLLAEYEVFGTRSYANTSEQNYQAQYAYYSNGNSKLRYDVHDTTSPVGWWLRSVYIGNGNNFCKVRSSGVSMGTRAYYSDGFAPAFCV